MKLDLTKEEANQLAETLRIVRYWFRGFKAAAGEGNDISVFHLADLNKLELALKYAIEKKDKEK